MASGGTGWNVLSGMIRKKVEDAREKHNAAEAQERQNEFDLIMEGVRAHAANGTLTDEMIQQAQDKMKKLVPKDAHPLVDAFHKVMGHVRDARKLKGQGQGQGQGQPPTPPPGAPAKPGSVQQPPSQAPQAQPAPAPTQTPAQPPAQPSAPIPTSPTAPPANAPAVPSSIYGPSAREMGESAATIQSAQETALATSRLSTLKAMRANYPDQEKGMPKELDNALTIWAVTGHMPTGAAAGMARPKMHPVSVIGPDNISLVPGMEDEYGNVWSNGQIVEDPKLMPKWKPRRGYAKDGQGKFFSFAIDPQTNQPVPGTENYSELPPAGYLEHVRSGVYHWTDDSGGVHESPFSVTSFAKVPSNVQGKSGTPAVPPAFAKLPKPKTGAKPSAGTGTGKGTSAKGDRVLGTKDTGILSAAGQKVLMTTEPVVNQARKLEKIFEDHPELKDNDQAGYLLMPYILYRLGYASDGALESEIAGLSLGSVIEAASVLQGTSRSISALRLAMVHTPNAKLDSPQQIYRKLHNDIIPRLDDVMEAAKKYGRKRSSVEVPPDMVGPPTKSDADKAAEEWLNSH